MKSLLLAVLVASTTGCIGHLAVLQKANTVACLQPVYVNAFGRLEKRDCATDAQLAEAVEASHGEF